MTVFGSLRGWLMERQPRNVVRGERDAPARHAAYKTGRTGMERLLNADDVEDGAGTPDDVVRRFSDRLRGWRIERRPRNVVRGERGATVMCPIIF